MAKAVYILCAATSLACALLLWRGYRRSGARFLLWSSLCFLCLTANNILLYLDLVVFTQFDLSVVRGLTALVGVALLLFGLIWETE